MAYTPNEWKDGDVITSEKLNKQEQGIKSGNVAPTWSSVTGKPTTFEPATHTHKYADLEGKPTIPTVPTTMSAAEATTGTATTARTISAKVLNDLIDAKIAAAKTE